MAKNPLMMGWNPNRNPLDLGYGQTKSRSSGNKGKRKNGAGRIKNAVVTTGMIGVTVAGARANPQQSSTTTQRNYGQSSLQSERDSQGRGQRKTTTAKGRQRGGSSKNA